MQDFKTNCYKLTLDQIREMIEAGKQPLILVNGEYYEIKLESEEKKK